MVGAGAIEELVRVLPNGWLDKGTYCCDNCCNIACQWAWLQVVTT